MAFKALCFKTDMNIAFAGDHNVIEWLLLHSGQHNPWGGLWHSVPVQDDPVQWVTCHWKGVDILYSWACSWQAESALESAQQVGRCVYWIKTRWQQLAEGGYYLDVMLWLSCYVSIDLCLVCVSYVMAQLTVGAHMFLDTLICVSWCREFQCIFRNIVNIQRTAISIPRFCHGRSTTWMPIARHVFHFRQKGCTYNKPLWPPGEISQFSMS